MATTYQCDRCVFNSTSRASFKEHSKVHQSAIILRDDGSSYTIKRNHEGRLSCQCGASFKQAKSLRSHMVSKCPFETRIKMTDIRTQNDLIFTKELSLGKLAINTSFGIVVSMSNGCVVKTIDSFLKRNAAGLKNVQRAEIASKATEIIASLPKESKKMILFF